MAFNISDLIQRSSSEGDIVITREEYQELCVSINALPQEDQSMWDNVVLNFEFDGKSLVFPEIEVARQNQGE